jgi:uncharacterized membrane protein YtjA (UPF0391 family)
MVAHHALLTGQIQSQAMSHAKFVFLIALVIFFVALFVAAYVWMRRPDFGQKGGRPMPTATDAHAVPVDAPKVTKGPLKSRRDDARQGDSR